MKRENRKNNRRRRLAIHLAWICLFWPGIIFLRQSGGIDLTTTTEKALGLLQLARPKLTETGPGKVEQYIEDSQTVVINYKMDREMITLFLIIPGTGNAPAEIRRVEIAVQPGSLAATIATFRERIAQRDPHYHREGRLLYDLLIGQVEGQLNGARRLCLILDSILWEIPFQALVDPKGRHLVEQFSIYYAPSMGVLGQLIDSGESEWRYASLLGLGNPKTDPGQLAKLRRGDTAPDLSPLPEAELEVKIVAQIHETGEAETGPSSILTGSEASESAFKQLAGQHQIIHLATHGIIDETDPLRSSLLLASPAAESGEDGLLEAQEIMRLELQADLAIVSACESGRDHDAGGAGMNGLSRAFLTAGCRTVIVSQWKIDSRRTAELIVSFFKFLHERRQSAKIGDGRAFGKADALRLAARKMMGNPATTHPFYWGGMIAMGRNH